MFYLIGVLLLGALSYKFDMHTVVKNTIVTKYESFRELNKLVGTRYSTFGMILWISFCMILKMYWIMFLQWVNSSVMHSRDKKTFELTYVVKGRMYKIFLTPSRIPFPFLLVTDENHDDMTDVILQYYGSSFDWHKTEFTPAFWGKKSLTFEMTNGETKSFSEGECLVI